MKVLQVTFFLPFNMQSRAPSRKNFLFEWSVRRIVTESVGGGNFLNASGHFSPSSSKQSLVRPFPFKSSEVRAARSTLSLSNEGWNAPSCFRLKGNMNCIHCRGYRDHVSQHWHWVNHPLPSYELRLRHFVVNNFQCREEFPCSKLTSFFLSYVWLFIKWVDISLPP